MQQPFRREKPSGRILSVANEVRSTRNVCELLPVRMDPIPRCHSRPFAGDESERLRAFRAPAGTSPMGIEVDESRRRGRQSRRAQVRQADAPRLLHFNRGVITNDEVHLVAVSATVPPNAWVTPMSKK